MAFLPIRKVKQPISDRQPTGNESLLKTVQKELWPFFQQVRGVLNWAVDWLGLVVVDDTDTPGTLWDKLLAGTGITRTLTGTPGARAYTLQADVDQIITIIQQSPIPPAQPPAVVASTLYPALVPDPKMRAPVRCLTAQGAGYGLNLVDLWTQIGGAFTWSKDATDPVLAYVDGGSGNFALSVGDRFAVVNTGSFASEANLSGTYEVLTQGDGVSVHAVIRRTADANAPATLCSGMVVRVTGTGVAFEGDYFTLDTVDPIVVDTTALTFSSSSSYTSAATQNLLTGPQLTSEGASSATLTAFATIVSGDADFEAFPTIAGTPGLAALPAGLWTFDIEGVWIDPSTPPSAGSTTTLKQRIRRSWGASGEDVFTAESPPISNTVLAPLSFQYDASAHDFAPTDLLVNIPAISTTSTTPVTLWMVFNSASRGTRITVPFEMAVSGASTGDHRQLSQRGALLQHPNSASYPVVDTTTGSDWLTLTKHTEDRANACRFTVTGSNEFLGIKKTWSDDSAIPDFFEIQIYIANATPSTLKKVINGATPPDSGYAPLALDAVAGAGKSKQFAGPTALWFWLNLAENRWCLKTFQTYTVPVS